MSLKKGSRLLLDELTYLKAYETATNRCFSHLEQLSLYPYVFTSPPYFSVLQPFTERVKHLEDIAKLGNVHFIFHALY